ncbi:hypothetical protein ACHBTE_16110 [Streptomyces sp. M41]|uniref:hypothetical protein n=1 Tax=Streptomyces sp. M41 TaxID=3059412 RepID=UPI00374C9B17
MTTMSLRARLTITALAATLLMSLALGYARLTRDSHGGESATATATTATGLAGERIQVLSNGRLSTVARSAPSGPRHISRLRCDRAYAGGRTVVCLTPVGALESARLIVLDADLREQRTVPLDGFPSRARVSADGRMVSWTLFIGGHSYANGEFATQTGILDTTTGELVRSLEVFKVFREGKPYRAADINFWGVTFADDDNRFYATMSTKNARYLVEGDLAARTVRTLTENVECPSLSPDGTRLAFKQAIDEDPAKGWRLSVLDLRSMRVTHSAETSSVDDQAAWLDDRTLLYGKQRSDGINDVWAVPADGGGRPRVLVPEANSPAPMR